MTLRDTDEKGHRRNTCPDRERLTQYIDGNNVLMPRVFFMGSHSDVKAYYCDFDVFLMSSIAEGIPMTLLESMSMSVPHLVTRVGGIKEVICEEETGLAVEAGDFEGYVQGMLTLYANPQRKMAMSRQARKRIMQKFSQQDMVDEYKQLYEKG